MHKTAIMAQSTRTNKWHVNYSYHK